jgi:hypothetical protein
LKSLKDLTDQRLSRDDVYNVWCDHLANNAWGKYTPVDDPAVTPAERWAINSFHPTYHKITGDFINANYSADLKIFTIMYLQNMTFQKGC